MTPSGFLPFSWDLDMDVTPDRNNRKGVKFPVSLVTGSGLWERVGVCLPRLVLSQKRGRMCGGNNLWFKCHQLPNHMGTSAFIISLRLSRAVSNPPVFYLQLQSEPYIWRSPK